MHKYCLATFLAIALLVMLGCKNQEKTKTPTVEQQEQKITELTNEDKQRLTKQRTVVEAYLGDDQSKQKYRFAPGKLGTIRAILEANIFKPDQTYELQCLGVVLGDALVQELKMEWIIVEDQYGRDPAVRLPGTTVILYPLTMISKRVEKGEEVDVFTLFNAVAAQVEELQKQRE